MSSKNRNSRNVKNAVKPEDVRLDDLNVQTGMEDDAEPEPVVLDDEEEAANELAAMQAEPTPELPVSVKRVEVEANDDAEEPEVGETTSVSFARKPRAPKAPAAPKVDPMGLPACAMSNDEVAETLARAESHRSEARKVGSLLKRRQHVLSDLAVATHAANVAMRDDLQKLVDGGTASAEEVMKLEGVDTACRGHEMYAQWADRYTKFQGVWFAKADGEQQLVDAEMAARVEQAKLAAVQAVVAASA